MFIWLEAEYENAKGVKNEVVVWDRIVRRKQDANIKYAGKNSYMFRDISTTFKCALLFTIITLSAIDFIHRKASPANYTLKYNIMPYVGLLTYGEAGTTSEELEFPPTQSRL